MKNAFGKLISRRSFTAALDKAWLLLFLAPRPASAQSPYCIANCNDQYVTCGDSSWCGGGDWNDGERYCDEQQLHNIRELLDMLLAALHRLPACILAAGFFLASFLTLDSQRA